VPNLAVDMNSWARSACYPRSTFYPLSDGPSTRDHRIIKPGFRLCSTCQSHSQAPLCLYTQRLIAKQPEGTFGRLRYILGKYVRPDTGILYHISLKRYEPIKSTNVSREFPVAHQSISISFLIFYFPWIHLYTAWTSAKNSGSTSQ